MSAPVIAERHVGFGDWPGNHGLLHEAAEYQSAAVRGAPVESECEFLQVRLEVGRHNGALMRAQEPAFEETDDAV